MEPKSYPHVFREANWVGYICIIFGLSIVWLALYGASHSSMGEGGVVAFLGFSGLAIWQGWKIVRHKKPLFQLGPEGLWTPKIGFMPWQEIQVELESVSGFQVGAITSLVIMQRKTRERHDSIALMSLGISVEEMGALLHRYSQEKAL